MTKLAWLNALNPQQREAVTHQETPLLILAGAGSGKTRVVTTRIAYLVEKLGFAPWSILAVTFTNKAAKEMRERVEELIPLAEGAMIRTFHSFGAWLLRRNGEALGLGRNFTIYDDEDVTALLKSLFEGLPRNELRLIARNISRAKDECLGPDDDLGPISPDPDFPDYYRRYEERLRAIGNADFGDLVFLSYRLLAENPAIRERLRQRFRVVLVDEYQDSNGAQFRLLKELVGPQTWFCVVGDDDQSIYRFRGAQVENILGFQNQFPQTRLIKLEENYRSTPDILEIASQVVAHNQGRLGKKLWTRQKGGSKPQLVYLEDQLEEAEFCASTLRENRQWGNSAILYRTNAQSRVFEQVFRKQNIPYHLVGTISFYSREEVKDALGYLAFLSNPADEVAFRRIVNKPSRGIGPKSVQRILQSEEGIPQNIEETLQKVQSQIRGKAAQGISFLIQLFGTLHQALNREQNLGSLLKTLLEESGLLTHYQEQDRGEGTQRVGNLEELVSAAAEYPASAEGLGEFLELVELDQGALEAEDLRTDRVTLITMHNTKGLEYDRVFITGLEEGLFPRSPENEEELEEERRLFYVSITRARKELYITSCRRRMLYGRFEEAWGSRFLEEIPKDRIEILGAAPLRVSSSPYSPGTRIYHDDYGEGVITKNLKNSGHLVIQVNFDTGHSMTFLPEFSGHQLVILGPAGECY